MELAYVTGRRRAREIQILTGYSRARSLTATGPQHGSVREVTRRANEPPAPAPRASSSSPEPIGHNDLKSSSGSQPRTRHQRLKERTIMQCPRQGRKLGRSGRLTCDDSRKKKRAIKSQHRKKKREREGENGKGRLTSVVPVGAMVKNNSDDGGQAMERNGEAG